MAKRSKAAKEIRPKRPPMRGWPGRGRGQASVVNPASEWRGTTVQVCGRWPFGVGAGAPMIGVPLGQQENNERKTVCCDPISWFQRAQIINNPSVFVLGRPGLGKSTCVRRMATGLAGYGTIPLVLGDLKPDYVDMVRALGGQVIELGRNRGHLNVLDPGEARDAAARLRAAGHPERAERVEADAASRRLTMVVALVTIQRASTPTDREIAILDRALKYLDANHDGIPVLPDLLNVIREAPADVRLVALDRGSDERYKELTENLEVTLMGLCGGGLLGDVFAKQTTEPMRRDRAVVFNVSSIPDGVYPQLRKDSNNSK